MTETVSTRTYRVEQSEADSLLQAIDRATPIREDGKIFHGYTTRNIHWNFRWNRASDGRCTLTRNNTQLSAEITLPELVTTGSPARREFSDYVSKLRLHEQGHVQIARSAAQRIDAGIAALPSMSSCPELEKTANQLGQRLIDQAKQEGRRYDEATGHGRTQGARLPR
ncbi:DUF922 domain-containing protein [Niveibacterium terrae]|uniref:DUF922 domain-containing protein n=1 Tax=Niveibacterium terrae TaxID=3373598 RepID=UPI003A950610